MESPPSEVNEQPSITPFGVLPDGRPVELHRLVSPGGTSADVASFGGIVTALRTRDHRGELADVVLGHDRLEDYVSDRFFLGALIGRYANRIARATCEVGGERLVLDPNDPPNHLHGGRDGFHKVLWTVRPLARPRAAALQLTHRSPDGHGGYPGNLDVTVVYALTDDALAIEYEAKSDRDTIVNLTHHGYFNLSGDLERPVTDHVAAIRAERFTPVDHTLIPTGELRAVAGTPFDFNRPVPIGARIDMADEQLRIGGGYDHNWVLDVPAGADVPSLVARFYCPASGRMLDVATTEPGMQFYSGNSIAPAIVGKGGARYGRRSAFCLETQRFPDSPNQPGFPSATLRAGQTYRSTTVYRFGTFDPGGGLPAAW